MIVQCIKLLQFHEKTRILRCISYAFLKAVRGKVGGNSHVIFNTLLSVAFSVFMSHVAQMQIYEMRFAMC